MTEPHRPRVKYVIGPDGSPLTVAASAVEGRIVAYREGMFEA